MNHELPPQADVTGLHALLTTSATLGFAMRGSAQGRRSAILGLSAYSAATELRADKILTASLTLAYMAHAPCTRNVRAQFPEILTSAKGLSAFQMTNARVSMATEHVLAEYAQQKPHVHLM